jgi:hypothetical protein
MGIVPLIPTDPPARCKIDHREVLHLLWPLRERAPDLLRRMRHLAFDDE